MKTYVVGAGVSHSVGYPLGGDLFDKLDGFVRGMGNWSHRFDYGKEWPALHDWLDTNTNPLIKEAYRRRQLEHLFTVLDLASKMNLDNFGQVARSVVERRSDARRSQAEAEFFGFKVGSSQDLILYDIKAENSEFDDSTKDYRHYRALLLFALESYFNYLHDRDRVSPVDGWDVLSAFGRKLSSGDVVITFNYDATLERVLLTQCKWSPRDGYGFEVAFNDLQGKTILEFSESPVKTLHLHGSIGWYNPSLTGASLDPSFLQLLGIEAIDSSLPSRPPTEDQILIWPTFLKNYELPSSTNSLFINMWKSAAEALRRSNEVLIIGYSLPDADAASFTLLTTNCDRSKVRIVNPSLYDAHRLRTLLSDELVLVPRLSLQEWLNLTSDAE